MEKNALPIFLSCDWGTTSFRLRLVQSPTTVLATVRSDMGIAAINKLWLQSQLPPTERLKFYQKFLLEQIAALKHPLSNNASNLPLVISGMASSTIGMLELPYKVLPVATNGSNLLVHKIPQNIDFPLLTFLASGICSENEVMRGEEVQLIGAIKEQENDRHLYILPGTHSKHIWVENEQIVDFQTFMTGEIFQLLKTQSILANSIEDISEPLSGKVATAFSKGVANAANSNLLNVLFSVRTNQLFDKNSKVENSYYLSGLLIGTELTHLNHALHSPITLVVDSILEPFYTSALCHLGREKYLVVVNIDEAIINGHQCILHYFN
jgi:2-dehydro-3-deoxygalactonokinase